MNPDEYRAARERSGIAAPHIWERVIRVTPDQNKAFSSGRTAIPPEVEQRVNELVARIEGDAEKLRAALHDVLPACDVKLHAQTLAITITFPKHEREIVLSNGGVDLLHGWTVYTADPRHSTIFLNAPEKLWARESQPHVWCLWRGHFVEKGSRHRQNHNNALTEDLLLEAFGPLLEAPRRTLY